MSMKLILPVELIREGTFSQMYTTPHQNNLKCMVQQQEKESHGNVGIEF